MFDRLARTTLDAARARSPAVAVLGPRQVGKTTLARAAAAARPGSVYLYLETAADLARLVAPVREGWPLAGSADVVSPLDLPVERWT